MRFVFKNFIFGVFVLFISAGTLLAQEVSQGFQSNEPLRSGLIVSLDPDSTGFVVAGSTAAPDSLHGVVIDAGDSPIVLSDDDSDVLVANSGTHDVLVSDANGPIKSGDYLSISSVSGITQKATDEQRIVIGRALEDYVPQEGSIVLSVASDGAGGEVNLGRIAADITVAQNPNLTAPEQDVPEFLSKAAELISGKDEPISPVRVYVSLAVLVLTGVISGSLIFTSVRSSIISIGRNPLSRTSILRSLLQVVVISFIVLLSGLFAVYLILRF